MANINSYIEEMIRGQKTIAVNGYEKENIRKFTIINNDMENISRKANYFSNLLYPVLTDIRKGIGVVLQEMHLFTGTIKENIQYGKLEATDAEIKRATQLAYADTFIDKLP